MRRTLMVIAAVLALITSYMFVAPTAANASTGVATATCVEGEVVITGNYTNTSDSQEFTGMDTDYGVADVQSVAPTEMVTLTVHTGEENVPAGTVLFTALRLENVEEQPVPVPLFADYNAAECTPLPPVDTDGDGVPDDEDECPDTSEGAEVNEVGCPEGSDGNEGKVCEGVHLKPEGNVTSLEVTAPEGKLIAGYCVKAGSLQQGNGPVDVVVDPPQKTVTISHPSGKDISHYVVIFVDDDTPPPPPPPPPPGDEDDDEDPPPPSPPENTPEVVDPPRRDPSVKGSNSSQAVEHTVGHTA